MGCQVRGASAVQSGGGTGVHVLTGGGCVEEWRAWDRLPEAGFRVGTSLELTWSARR